ncbi:MAG: hypothetical protein ACYDA8_15535, partial [Deferrisomatales bacterium]
MKKRSRWTSFVVMAVAALLSAGLSEAATTSGALVADETWTGTVTVTGNLTVPAGVSLTVEPGTTVKVGNGVGVTVSGTLLATGATFTRADGATA